MRAHAQTEPHEATDGAPPALGGRVAIAGPASAAGTAPAPVAGAVGGIDLGGTKIEAIVADAAHRVLGSGLHLNSVTPEQAAAELRELAA